MVKNKIAQLRKKAGLTRRALGARLATTQQQIERWESGREIAPGIAEALAHALNQPAAALFPRLSEGPPTDEDGWRRLGFDLDAPAFTWEIELELRGFDRPFRYLIDRKDADRIAGILDRDLQPDFVTFDSVGRSILVSVKDIQYVLVLNEASSLSSGVENGAGHLQPLYSDLRLYFRDRAAPLSIDAFGIDELELETVFAHLTGATNAAGETITFGSEACHLTCIRTGELVLAEVPRTELLAEMIELDDEFWSEPAPTTRLAR